MNNTVPLIELPAFQGPLDLLLHLIQQEKVDIYDIPIARIADQFVATLRQMEEMDMEVTSEFLVLAAQLLYMKSRMLLPKPPKEELTTEEEDPRQELVERLLAYKAYKEIARTLSSLENEAGHSYFREIDVEELTAALPKEDPLKGIDFEDLWKAFQHVIERVEKGEEITHIPADEISIEIMVKDVWRRVLLHPDGIFFARLLRGGGRLEVITAFLAVLELLKAGRIRAEQAGMKGEISIFPTEKAWEFKEDEAESTGKLEEKE